MKHSVRFGLLLSPAEERALKRLAAYEGGLSKAAMIRNLIRREARERGLWVSLQADNGNQAQESHPGSVG
jgi:hypothetical protein